MVSMLLISLVLSASLYALGRSSKLQYSNIARSKLIDQIRRQMISSSLSVCGTTQSLTVYSQSISVSYTCTPYTGVTATFPGVSGAVSVTVASTVTQQITASATADILGGTLTVSSSGN